jgi:UPF0716 protein FxsA
MRPLLSLSVLALVLAEIAGFVLVGEAVGVMATLLLVLFGIIAGTMLLRWYGTAAILRIKAEIEAGRLPAQSLAEGALLTAAALLIILPGFISDLAGILLLIPQVRQGIRQALRRRLTVARLPSAAFQPLEDAVVDLDAAEYAAEPRRDSPWRHGRGRA